MSRTKSGYAPQRLHLYETPAWVVAEGLAVHIPVAGLDVCDPCCGRGAIARALHNLGAGYVFASDIKRYKNSAWPADVGFEVRDFLSSSQPRDADLLVINPPYGPQGRTAEAFIRRAVERIRRNRNEAKAAILLPSDFDHASSRGDLFEGNPYFAGTIRLRRRIVWFKKKGSKSGPSENHCWFIFSSKARDRGAAPWTLYAPDPVLPLSRMSEVF